MKTLSPYHCPHLRVAYDMSLETFANAAAIGTLTDQTGNGFNLTQATAGNKPICRTASLGGHRIAEFTDAASSFMAAATAADWTFLHNGSGSTVITVLRPTGTSDYIQIWDTGTDAQTNIGAGLNIGVASADRAIYASVNRGVGATNTAVATSANNAVLPGRACVITTRFKYSATSGRLLIATGPWTVWVNGVKAAISALNAAPSVASPSAALRIGRLALGATPYYGDWDLGAMFFFDQALNDETLDQIGRWLDDRWGVHYASTFAEDGYYNAFGDVVRDPRGNLFHMGYYKGQQHEKGRAILVARSSPTGREWSPERLLYRAPADTQGRSASFSGLSDGNLYAITSVQDDDGTSPFSAIMLKSTDSARIWAAPVTIANSGFTDYTYSESPMVENGAAGTCYLPVYGQNTAAAFTSVKLMKTTDYGATWALQGTIANGITDSRSYNECGILFRSSTTIVAFIRSSPTDTLYFSKSTDTGATWSSPAAFTTPAGTGWPRPLTLASGRVILPMRVNAGNRRPAIWWSTDTANDYGHATTSWHGPYYPDCIDGGGDKLGAVEIVAGEVLLAIFSEPGAFSTSGTPPSAFPALGRSLIVKESDIALV